jgi:hypothetical protein
MNRTSWSLGCGVVAGVAAWFAAPYMGHDIAEAWFIGTGNWHVLALHGQEIVAGIAAIASSWVSSITSRL